jgi:hypothetical protein
MAIAIDWTMLSWSLSQSLEEIALLINMKITWFRSEFWDLLVEIKKSAGDDTVPRSHLRQDLRTFGNLEKRFWSPRTLPSAGLGAGCRVLLHELRWMLLPMFDLTEVGYSRFSWLAEPLSLDELEAALYQCNNSWPGLLDFLRFSLFKALAMEAKLGLLDIYNEILATGLVPQSWHRTKVMPIVKPGKNPLISGSYRPICLLVCGRHFWAENNGIFSPT